MLQEDGSEFVSNDIDLTWLRVERLSETAPSQYYPDLIVHKPVLLQYLYFLTLSTIECLAFHIAARTCTRRIVKTTKARGNMISTALLISSCNCPLSNAGR